MTGKQQKDIDTARYFIPRAMKGVEITQEHIDQYLAVSERGEKNAGKFDENPLIQGKRNRGLHMGLWEEGVLEGSVPYFTLLGENEPIPRLIVDFMKKEMFKGLDAEQIEYCYQSLLQK
jgi:hypothetical protein